MDVLYRANVGEKDVPVVQAAIRILAGQVAGLCPTETDQRDLQPMGQWP